MTELLKVEHLTKHFPVGGGRVVHAVDDVSFTIQKGTTLGLVGESGCGKSSCARTIIRIYEPTSGSIYLDGDDISALSQKQLLPYRRKMQMIFQDPYAMRVCMEEIPPYAVTGENRRSMCWLLDPEAPAAGNPFKQGREAAV